MWESGGDLNFVLPCFTCEVVASLFFFPGKISPQFCLWILHMCFCPFPFAAPIALPHCLTSPLFPYVLSVFFFSLSSFRLLSYASHYNSIMQELTHTDKKKKELFLSATSPGAARTGKPVVIHFELRLKAYELFNTTTVWRQTSE